MAFIAIDSDTSWQDLAIAEQLATSYNLRRTLCGLSTISAPTQATEVYAFVRAMQEGIEAMADDLWLNNSSAISGYTGQSSYPSIMSLSSAMSLAGLTTSGYWRRKAEGGTQPATWTDYGAAGWSYGKITSKDLAGPWLFKDLQLALSALTRCRLGYTRYRIKSGSYNSSPPIPSTALSFGSWQSSGTAYPSYYVNKGRLYNVGISIYEWQRDIAASVYSCETSHLMLTIPTDSGPYPGYAAKTGKTNYSLLSVSDVTTVFDVTVGNSVSATTSGSTTSYTGIIAEDASNLIPLCNDIVPDANVPAICEIRFANPCLIIDFAFE
jgi:hypothetical protein